MSYCINPRCPNPRNPVDIDSHFCRHCGSCLLLFDGYRAARIMSDNSGFAIVYEISDGTTHKILKALKPAHNENKKVVELFRQEASLLSQLRHPGIPKVEANSYFLYTPRDGGEPLHCFVMEKIEGPTLKEWMHQQGNLLISERQALHWIKQLAEILQVVHQQNFLHRDLKLQNIMLRPNGQLVLIDFGAAREISYSYLARTGVSRPGAKISSAGYTPPEQAKGHAVPQSDFYALGRTFIYLLTGQQFGEGNVLYDPLTDKLNWRKYALDISSEFADFLDRLMASKASDRPKDAGEIIKTVNQLLQSARDRHPPNNGRRIPLTDLHLSPDSPTLTQGTQDSSNRHLTLASLAIAWVAVWGQRELVNLSHPL
ncbi:serine/threonine-protein kinase [Oscillatoria sp. FACHB-1406]|uniref:serine/threonine protein kinase n=1 Tax=Oscillatoria sp. FACHB-1406 TaxID=2692846 RepID=UPI001686C87F|nr:serine/threonine-protein kinase [Oscillatoria sp. FACHB-1406]MBD2577629.1 serine/threonine protein kinase [Oscillatoria sp. FACHB-1406]